jgi:hypothetical protein
VKGLVLEGSDFAPHFLPDGNHFLYYVRGTPEVRGVYVGALDRTLETRRLFEAETGAVYAPSGHLLFGRQRTLHAWPFDPDALKLSGSPFVVAEGISIPRPERALTVSETGAIAYRSQSGSGPQQQFVWFDRAGHELERVGDGPVQVVVSEPSLSPDNQRVVFYGVPAGNPDVLTLDTKTGATERLTTNAADDVWPIWSPDGGRVVFSSNRAGIHDLYVKSRTGDQTENVVLSTPQPKTASDWSRDGRFLLFNTRHPQRGFDIWAVPMNETPRKAFPVVETSFDESGGQFSPDGRWIAYQSNRGGRQDIYVTPFPGPGPEQLISTNGGSQVRWGRDGKELFYIARNGKLVAVPVRTPADSQILEAGQQVELFTPRIGNAVLHGDYRHQYMVTSDSKRFLVATVKEDLSTSPIMLILNWKPRN